MELNSDYFTNDLNKIKDRYKNKTIDLSYAVENELNQFHFLLVIFELKLEPKIKELQKKLENDENIDEIHKSISKELLETLIKELKQIGINSEANWEYSDNLLKKIEKDYMKNKNKKDAKMIYDNICREIIDSDVKKYIKYEKEIIIIFEKYKSLNNLF